MIFFCTIFKSVIRELLNRETWFQSHIVGQLESYPMVVETWESIQESLSYLLCVRHFFKHLRMACTKTFTAELIDVSKLWDFNEKKVEELLYLLVFGVLEVKYDLDRTGMKK